MILFLLMILILVVTFYSYGMLPFTFFQQDEWAVMSNYLDGEKLQLHLFDTLFIHGQHTHLIPLSNIISYLQFKIFGLNFFGYGVVSIGIHFINTILVFWLSRLLVKKNWLAFLAALLFCINSIPSQAIIWTATTTGTGGTVIFLLLCLIFFTMYFQNPKRKIFLLLSYFFAFLSFLFKETSLFLFLFLPLFYYFYKKKNIRELFKIVVFPLFLLGLFYVCFRQLIMFIGDPVPQDYSDLSQPTFFVYILRFLTIPLKFLTQSFLSIPAVLYLSNSLIHIAYPQFVKDGVADPYIRESVSADIINLVIGLFMLGIGYFQFWYFNKNGERNIAKIVIISLVFLILCSLPLVAIPGSAGYFSLIEGRHLYIGSAFSSILVVIFLYFIYKITPFKKVIFIICVTSFLLLTVYHIKKIRHELYKQTQIAEIRTDILSTISATYPTLPDKVIFYVESDKAYYGFPPEDTIVPFQSGFGHTLLVWYELKGEEFPSCFFKELYLYALVSQGYRECEGRGFGYFRNKKDLVKELKEKRISKDIIVGFRFYSLYGSLENITSEVRNEL